MAGSRGSFHPGGMSASSRVLTVKWIDEWMCVTIALKKMANRAMCTISLEVMCVSSTLPFVVRIHLKYALPGERLDRISFLHIPAFGKGALPQYGCHDFGCLSPCEWPNPVYVSLSWQGPQSCECILGPVPRDGEQSPLFTKAGNFNTSSTCLE